MKAYQELPADYRRILQINLQSDKKTAVKVNAGGAIAMIAVFVVGHCIVPLGTVLKSGLSDYFLRLGAALLGYAAYIILHELTHAAVMKAVGGGKVRFGMTRLYAYAGSETDYFDKVSYRCIALAPLIVWGIVFLALALAVPADWFWVVWFLEAGNVGGAAGDVYVTARLWKLPGSILVRDTGVDMTVYDK